MSRCFVSLVFAALMTAVSGSAQTSDSNPGHSPDVFLDNHRPLIKKKDKAATTRSVSGKVVDDSGQALSGALVTLTNMKSKEKTTFITKNDGRYNFDDLSFTIDYKLEAKYKDQSSEVRNLSQYDHSDTAVRILQIGSNSEADVQKVTAAPKK